MKFCCGGFEGAYCIGNHFGINIRMVKFTSPIFLDGGYELFRAHHALGHHTPEHSGPHRPREHARRRADQLRTACTDHTDRTTEPDDNPVSDHACSDAAGDTGRHKAGPDTSAGTSSGIQDGAQHFRQGPL